MPGPRALGRLIGAFAALAVAATAAAAGQPRRIDECDAAVRAAPGDYASYDCYRRLAHAAQQWDAAVEHLEALLARDAGNTLARVVLARIESDRGQPRAEELFRVSADEFAAGAMPVGEVFARLDLAFLLRRQGRLDDAAAEVERAREAATAANVPLLLANVRAEEAWIADSRGDYGRAHALFLETEQEVFPVGPWTLQTSVLSGIGSTLWAMGRFGESLATYRRLADAHRDRGDLFDEAGDRYNVALLAGKLVGEGTVSVEEHRRLTREALDVALRSGNRGVEAATRLSIAEDRDLDIGERRREVERARALAEEIGDESRALFALRELAAILVAQDPRQTEVAYLLADEAVQRGRATGDPLVLTRGLVRRAQVRWVLGPRDRAIAEGIEALDAIERIRDLQRDDLVRARLASEWSFYYYILSGGVLSGRDPTGPEDLELAFSIMERLRGRVLLDALDAAHATSAIGDRGPVHEKRDEILGAIEREQRRLLETSVGPAERDEALQRLDRLEAQEVVLRETLAGSDPTFAALYRPALPTLVDLRQALRPDEALLAFQIADRVPDASSPAFVGGSYVFVVTSAGVRVYELPEESDLLARVSIYLGFLGRRDGSDVPGAVSLYHDLLGVALAELPAGVDHLVIVADKVLFRLPFDALREGPERPPLGARYSVSIVPSAALWLRWRRSAEGSATIPALVLADPALGLGPLPYARREAREIVRALGGASRARVGDDASESFVESTDLTRFRVLHFAVHAVIDDAHPERSALVLAPGEGGLDGLLHIREIVGLDLPGSVVVLSACRGTAGPLLSGEGAMSLARGFFQAGARAVVGNLWPLRDDEAASVAAAFYGHLARGASVDEALARARRDLIHDGQPAMAWAGWVVMGDGSAVPFPGGVPVTWPSPWLLALGLAALVGVVAWLRRARLRSV